jgi:hypothetical protein
MAEPEWKIQQPPIEEMTIPVRCMHCRAIYSLMHVLVTGRYTDCSVWTSPCCGVSGIDDRPWVRDRHYREIDKAEAASGGDFYDVFGLRHSGRPLGGERR